MQLNKVKLKCKDQEVSYWENITITSGLNELSRSFSLGVTYSFPKQKKLHDVFKPGDKVQIFIDDDLVLTGYIDQTPIQYNGTSISVQTKCRLNLQKCNLNWLNIIFLELLIFLIKLFEHLIKQI